MKHTFTLSILAAATAFTALGAPVTPRQALDRLSSSPQARKAAGVQTSSMTQIASLPELYVFSNGNGFLVLPADDIAQPLLAYADEGTFDLEGNPTLRWWLSTYSEQIAAAQAASAPGTLVMRSSRNPIAPLTATRWNQSEPYNDLCPELDGKRCVTGCVATAMAQVLKYHAYPEKGTSTHSYEWSTGGKTLSFDYGATTFDWSAMTDTYDASSTAESKTAVATLMYACGVSVDMNYTAQESGAASTRIGPSLIEYFGYDKALWSPMRQYYGLEEWEDLIYADLEQGLPVLYCGVGAAGGHQFVCDGYSADGFFHFNWGWGGLSDGYFQLTALNPPSLGIGGGAGGFNSDQAVVLGVKKPVEGSVMTTLIYCSSDFEPSAITARSGSQVTFGGGFYNYSCLALPVGTSFGVEFAPESGNKEYSVASVLSSPMEVGYGYRTLTVNLPSNLADGTYTVRPVYKPVDGEWQTMRAPLSAIGELTATVSNGTVTFSASDAPNLKVSDLKLTSGLYWGSDFTLTFSATNAGKEEYYGTLIPALISTDGTALIAEADSYPVDLESGKTESCTYAGIFSAESEPAAGTYLLVLLSSETGRPVSNAVEVTLNAAPERTVVSVKDFKAEDNDGYTVRFTLTATCDEGYFAGPLIVAVFSENGGSSVAEAKTEPVYISAGQSAATEASVSVSGLAQGRYQAAVFGSSQLTGALQFDVSRETLMEEITADADAVKVYDLQGRQVLSPRRGGFYIVGSTIRAY